MTTRPMTDTEAVEMMRRCAAEIRSMRAEIDALRPKADAYDNIAVLIRLLPRPSVGASEDVAWVLDRRIKELTSTAGDNAV